MMSEGDLGVITGHAQGSSGDDGYAALSDAIKSGKTEIVKSLLQNGVKVISETDRGNTPLHLAAERRYVDLEVIRLLLANNAPINAQNGSNETPLHIAVRQGYDDKVEFLLNNDASIVAQTTDGSTPLVLALEGRHAKIVQLILEYVHKNDTNLKNDKGSVSSAETSSQQILFCDPGVRDKINKSLAQMIIKEYNGYKIVDYLTDCGFTFDHEYIDESLLRSATEKNYAKLIKNILTNFVDLEISKKYPLLLHTAVKYSHKEIIKLFLDSGFAVNLKDEEGKMPICYSLKRYGENDSIEILQLLLAGGADIKEAPEILHQAVTKAYFKFCKILIENGADVNAQNSSGNTPLHLTVHIKQISRDYYYGERQEEENKEAIKVEIAELLLTNYADKNIKGADGYTAFHRAVSSGKEELVQIFLNFGVYIDLPANNGATALHLASQSLHEDIVDILLDNHADVNARQSDGRTPLHCCSYIEGDHENSIAETLLDNGSDFNAETNDGETALSIALSSGKSCYVQSNENTLEERRIDEMIGQSYDLAPGEEAPWVQLEDCVEDYELDEYDAVRSLRKHLIKLEAAGLYVSEKNLNLVKDDYCHSNFKEECAEEVKRIKNEKLKPPLTLFNILADGKTLTYLKNKSLMQKLMNFKFEKFPIYGSLLRANFENSKSRLELLDSGQKSLGTLVKISSRLNENKCVALPSELLEQIVLYLSNGEIESVIRCKELLKYQVSQ